MVKADEQASIHFKLNESLVQPSLFDVKSWLEVSREASRVAREEKSRIKLESSHSNHVARMQQFLASSDPILIAEALAWAEVNPGVLDVSAVSIRSLKELSLSQGTDPSEIPEFSDVLAAISVYTDQLGWSREQVGDFLYQLFGKYKQSMLDDQELTQWLNWLQKIISSEVNPSLENGCLST